MGVVIGWKVNTYMLMSGLRTNMNPSLSHELNICSVVPKCLLGAAYVVESRVWVKEALARRRCRLLEDSILVDPYGPEFWCV
jgi:hypothetical protein